MTQTLTTEQLRARAKFWREKAVEAKWESVSIAQDMLQNADAFDELAANREAQPVAFPKAKDKSQGWKIDPEYLQAIADVVGCSDDEGAPSMELVEAILIAAAPPAPAVPDEETKTALEKVISENWRMRDVLRKLLNKRPGGVYFNKWEPVLLEALNAPVTDDCRAAMLAQPVSSGYTLNSPVIPDGWISRSERMPELDKRVLLYFGSYDGHIEDGCIGDDGDGPYHYFFDGDSLQQEPTHWMPLPAAPEGGNGA